MSAEPGRGSRPLSSLLVEIGSVVFAVLLALGVNECWEDREADREAEATVEAIVAEIGRNRERLVADMTSGAGAGPDADLDAAITAFRGGEEPPDTAVVWDVALLSSAAWETARLTGTVREMGVEAVVDLAELYELQRYFLADQDALVRVISGMGAGLESRPVETLIDLRSKLAAARASRRTLATAYACALVRLEGVSAVEPGACPSETSPDG